MDVLKLIKLAWPAFEGQTVMQATGRADRKALRDFINRWKGESTVPFDALINFGSRENGPSLVLSDDAQGGLFGFLSKGTRSTTREALGRRVERSLSLMPTYWWHRRVGFRENGTIDYTAGQDMSQEVPQIRKEFLTKC